MHTKILEYYIFNLMNSYIILLIASEMGSKVAGGVHTASLWFWAPRFDR